MSMHGTDSNGNRVSLLSEHNGESQQQSIPPQRPPLAPTTRYASSHPNDSRSAHRNSTSSLNTPDLVRSNSYDSESSADPRFPPTPSTSYEGYYPSQRHHLDITGHEKQETEVAPRVRVPARPRYNDNSRAPSYEDEPPSPFPTAAPTTPAAGAPAPKRFPCRYAEKYNCDKTFTTSGHASRHSKIHTSEKSVACTFAGCTKKFTRSDNMKQHRETHDKAEKARSSGSGANSMSRPNPVSRRSSTARIPGVSSGRIERPAIPPSPSAAAVASWDIHGLHGLHGPLTSRPRMNHNPTNPNPHQIPTPLETLSMAAAVFERNNSEHEDDEDEARPS